MAENSEYAAGNTVPADVVCKLLGLNERTLYYHARNGTVPKPIKGRFDVIGCVRGYIEWLKGKLGNKDKDDPKQRVLAAHARIAETKADLLDGTAYRRTHVETAWSEILSTLRLRLLQVPTKAGPLVFAAASQTEAIDILTTAIHDALSVLSNTPAYAEAPPDRPTGDEGDGDDMLGDVAAAAEVDGEPVGG